VNPIFPLRVDWLEIACSSGKIVDVGHAPCRENLAGLSQFHKIEVDNGDSIDECGVSSDGLCRARLP
jgi:hypothetical protein